MQEWAKLKVRCPNAKMVCIDITPGTTAQTNERSDILAVAGWNDTVFEVINSFVNGDRSGGGMAKVVNAVDLNNLGKNTPTTVE